MIQKDIQKLRKEAGKTGAVTEAAAAAVEIMILIQTKVADKAMVDGSVIQKDIRKQRKEAGNTEAVVQFAEEDKDRAVEVLLKEAELQAVLQARADAEAVSKAVAADLHQWIHNKCVKLQVWADVPRTVQVQRMSLIRKKHAVRAKKADAQGQERADSFQKEYLRKSLWKHKLFLFPQMQQIFLYL